MLALGTTLVLNAMELGPHIVFESGLSEKSLYTPGIQVVVPLFLRLIVALNN